MAASLTLLATADVTGEKIDAAPGIEPTKPKRIDQIARAGQIFVLMAVYRKTMHLHYYWGTDKAALEKIMERPQYNKTDSHLIHLLPPDLPADHGFGEWGDKDYWTTDAEAI